MSPVAGREGTPVHPDPRVRMIMDVIALLATVRVDQHELVDRVARIVCADVADCCAIAFLSEDGRRLHPLGVYDRRSDVMAELEAQPGLAWDPTGGISERALETREPILVTDTEPAVLARGRPLAQKLLERVKLDSAVVAAMRCGGTSLGVVNVGRTEGRRPFSSADVAYIQTVADHLALGLLNVRLQEVLERSAGSGESDVPDDLARLLTDRERQILKLIGDGLTNREIAERLYLSVRTIEWHRSNLAAKLGLTRRSDLIAAGRRVT
jgi:DNA-binding CsgD family transcriptional regulator